ncbi:hypothetical protein SLS56_009416 [Neofusicoccum ribis]|uniref:Uncharacterized protein n=1 Tax=Neofusicoccum ribis TaxID=45134 RepID=A0ABR3SHE9_9PEZI
MGLGTVLIMTDYSDHQNNSVFMFTQGESGDYILNWHARTEDQGHFVTGNGGFKAQILESLRCAGIFMVAAYSYNEILVKYRGDHTSTSLSHIWKMWLGKLDINTSGGPIAIGPPVQTTIIRPDGSSAKLYVARTWLTILAANAPHTLVSIAYLLINSQLTAMVQLRDWSSLAARRQPLRVSSPAPGSSQISTYRLSLPYKYSLTLLASSTLLNWLLSQSLFFYRYKVFGDDGEEWDFGSPFARWAGGYDGTAGIGYSSLGVTFTHTVGVGKPRQILQLTTIHLCEERWKIFRSRQEFFQDLLHR